MSTTFHGYPFPLMRPKRMTFILLGLSGQLKIFDLALSRYLATLHLQPQDRCWLVLPGSRCSEHMTRNLHVAALRTRTMSDGLTRADSQGQRKTKFATCDIKQRSCNLHVSFVRKEEYYRKISMQTVFSFVHNYLPPFNALSLISIGKNPTTKY